MDYHIWTNIGWVHGYSGSHFWHFKDVWGHLFSAKINPAKATQAHSGMSLPHAHKGPIILQTLPAYSPAKIHFAKGGKTIKLQILLNVSGAIKNVYYSIGNLCWYLPTARHMQQILQITTSPAKLWMNLFYGISSSTIHIGQAVCGRVLVMIRKRRCS